MSIQLRFMALRDGTPILEANINGLGEEDLAAMLRTYRTLLSMDPVVADLDTWKAMVASLKDTISENVRQHVAKEKAAYLAAHLGVEMPMLTVT